MQISYLVYRFYELYKIDLLEYLKTFMNTEQLAQVQTIIKNKPISIPLFSELNITEVVYLFFRYSIFSGTL